VIPIPMEEQTMSFGPKRVRFGGVLAAGLSVLIAAPAIAGICFTSGKVYVQQKVYDKAAWQLECARKEEPDNPQAYALLAFARGELRQFAATGAVYQLGLQAAQKKKDTKRAEEMENNRRAKYIDLFNSGVKALQRAGKIAQDDSRTTDEGSPQGAIQKERGEPKDFARFTENGKAHEFWYYPEQKAVYHFAPGSDEALQIEHKPFLGAQDPNTAVTDTTVYPLYTGASALAEAAYNFELAMLVDPTSSDIYKNLSYVYEVLGRTDDAIRAAQKGLAIKPGDKDLTQNLRVAAMGRGNRLFKSEKYAESIPAYRAAMSYDDAGKVQYLSLIADAFQNMAKKADGAQQAAYYDSAGVAYMSVYESAPADSSGAAMKENALYNAAIIQVNLKNNKKAAEILAKGTETFPNSKDLWLLTGQVKFELVDYDGAITAMKRVVELNPKEADAHQILFHAYNKTNKKSDSVAEYTIYKALSEGKPRTGSQLKTWVDSAGNRLPKNHQLDKTKAAEGYPEEVRTFMDGDKTLESWFYWTKGKSITFLEGQVFSQVTFPPAKM
jgi:tetratricopeptide (TPR) repeat protein